MEAINIYQYAYLGSMRVFHYFIPVIEINIQVIWKLYYGDTDKETLKEYQYFKPNFNSLALVRKSIVDKTANILRSYDILGINYHSIGIFLKLIIDV